MSSKAEGKGGTALFRNVESVHECFESRIILAIHGQDQLGSVASLQQDEHFAQVVISTSCDLAKISELSEMAAVSISADSLELCETLLENVMGRSRGRHEGGQWKREVT
jgi:hypothetical protein